jgi:sugar (pentulose or hexulose) kinase
VVGGSVMSKKINEVIADMLDYKLKKEKTVDVATIIMAVLLIVIMAYCVKDIMVFFRKWGV